jgi:hypothetical protein
MPFLERQFPLVFRTPSSTGKISALVRRSICCLCLVLGIQFLVSCSQHVRAVQAQVFITTRGGDTIKLSNVPVFVCTEEMGQKLVETYNVWSATTTDKNYSALKDVIEKSLATYKALDKQFGTTAYASPDYLADKLDTIRMIKKYENTRELFLHEVLLEESAVRESGKPLFTDAEGTVTYGLTEGQTYYIFALAHRQISDEEQETCSWLVQLKVKGDVKINLSNNNLWNMDSQGAQFGFKPPPHLPAYPELQ